MSRLFWDTNLFIYLIEAVQPFDSKIQQVIQSMRQRQIELITSALTVCETMVYPIKQQDQLLIQKYQQLFSGIEIVPIQQDLAPEFAGLRARPGIKTPDALQLACAKKAGAGEFLTNDDRLTSFSDQTLAVYGLDAYLKAYPLS